MKRLPVLLCLLALILVIGAGVCLWGDPAQAQDQTPTPPPDDFPGQPLIVQTNEHFSGAGTCTTCHTNMVDEAGTDVSIGAYWRSTMMANAARDPYWQASVRVEVLNAPDYQAVIEDKCATCHMPMGYITLDAQDQDALVLDMGMLSPDHALHALAMDGNSCTLCHQIEADNLGESASFSGGFVIDTELPRGERVTYSPFEVDEPLSIQMAAASGFVPVQGMHITEAEMCASCHTLYTPYLDTSGQIAGEFPEQMPYFEWQHSNYAPSTTCQACHMPQADGGVVTSITGGEPRSPFLMHNFTGGNAYLQRVFLAFGPDMNVTASSDDFVATYNRTLDRLQNQAAIVTLENVAVSDDTLQASVRISVLTGHKFPTGFPSRRVWLHVTVTDSTGTVIFESGEYQPDGRILDDDHDSDPTLFEPHYTVIDRPDQVQIYESVMGDVEGNVTNKLLLGAGYLKDNRLLPMGFDKATAGADFAVVGGALDDADFTGGQDVVPYVVDISGAEGPFTVEVDLLYLSIGYNWVQKLVDFDSPESNQFLAYYDQVDNTPVLVASANATTAE
ncbi:MAG: hypothetical protein GYB65_00405 [Chloroflexi bacterium]|nr:hypothetical protein [Chloroflexota bacterium]